MDGLPLQREAVAVSGDGLRPTARLKTSRSGLEHGPRSHIPVLQDSRAPYGPQTVRGAKITSFPRLGMPCAKRVALRASQGRLGHGFPLRSCGVDHVAVVARARDVRALARVRALYRTSSRHARPRAACLVMCHLRLVCAASWPRCPWMGGRAMWLISRCGVHPISTPLGLLIWMPYRIHIKPCCGLRSVRATKW